MADDGVLAGVTMSAEDARALLLQRGPVTTAKWRGWCKAGQHGTDAGDELALCARWGWVHKSCLDEARAALEAGDE